MRSQANKKPDRWLFAAVLVFLFLAPLPFGSNRMWAVCALAVALLVLLLVSWGVLLKHGESPLARLAPAWLPLSALWALALLIGGQSLGGLQGTVFHSADPYQTRLYLLASLAYTAQFMLVILLVRSAERARMLVFTLVAAGVVQAMIGIVLLSARAKYYFLFEEVDHSRGRAIGTFVNFNHMACYLYLCLSVGIGWLVGSLSNEGAAPRRMKDHVVALLQFVLSPRMALRVLMVVMVIALVLTRSRMGNAAFFTALLVMAAVVAARVPALRRKAGWLVVSLLVVDLLVLGQWVGLERVVDRLESTALAQEDKMGEETLEARLEPARRSLPMIAERPWLGYGGGTFYTVFPEFKTHSMLLHLLYFDHAHNDYAELAADLGLGGLSLLIGVVVATLWQAWQGVSLRHTAQTRGVAYAALLASCCVILHSWVDFNLQIPANALTFTTILALIWAAPWRQLKN